MRRGAIVVAAGVGALVLGIAVLIGAGAASNPSQCGAGTGPSAIGQPQLIRYFIKAAQQYNLGAQGYAYLAGINEVETSFGTNIATSSAGAVGWMQFEPSTWVQYRVTPSGAQAPDDPSGWNDPGDAIYTAAKYLAASGAPADWSTAVYGYNHAGWYVKEVTDDAAGFLGTGGLTALSVAIAKAYHTAAQPLPVGLRTTSSSGAGTNGTTTNGTATNATSTSTSGSACVGSLPVPITPGSTAKIETNGLAEAPASAPQAVKNMIAAGNQIIDEPYVWGGGHSASQMGKPDGPGGYDCSGSTSYVLWGGGLSESVLHGSPADSTTLEGLGQSGPGTWVTWYANAAHAWIIVAGIALDTSNSYSPSYGGNTPEPPGSGPRWITASAAERYELTVGTDASQYVNRHPAGL